MLNDDSIGAFQREHSNGLPIRLFEFCAVYSWYKFLIIISKLYLTLYSTKIKYEVTIIRKYSYFSPA